MSFPLFHCSKSHPHYLLSPFTLSLFSLCNNIILTLATYTVSACSRSMAKAAQVNQYTSHNDERPLIRALEEDVKDEELARDALKAAIADAVETKAPQERLDELKSALAAKEVLIKQLQGELEHLRLRRIVSDPDTAKSRITDPPIVALFGV